MDALVSVDHALRAVLAMARVTPGEAVRLGDAVGRTLAEPVASREPHPPFDASAMDGVALRVADLPDSLTLPLAGVVHAGDAPGELASGVAVAIMTGAPVPAGADAVVPVERTTRVGDAVRLDARHEQQVVPGGEMQGQREARARQELSPARVRAGEGPTVPPHAAQRGQREVHLPLRLTEDPVRDPDVGVSLEDVDDFCARQ